MNKIVYATQKILEEGRNIESVSYKKNDGQLTIIFSHSAANDRTELRLTTWEKMHSLFPSIANLTFEGDAEILVFNASQ